LLLFNGKIFKIRNLAPPMKKEVVPLEGKITPDMVIKADIRRGDEIWIYRSDGPTINGRFFLARNTQIVQGGILEYLPHDKWNSDLPKGMNCYLEHVLRIEYLPASANRGEKRSGFPF
jgi:hypothetical protein